MGKFEIKRAHTQDVVVVYTSDKEKAEIRATAALSGKAMSKYLLDLHLKNMKENDPEDLEILKEMKKRLKRGLASGNSKDLNFVVELIDNWIADIEP